jgi:hypothetical protein
VRDHLVLDCCRLEVPGGEFVRPVRREYNFPVCYLENIRFDPAAPRWLAFTAIILAKQGPPIAPAEVTPYLYPTVLDGAGETKVAAWHSLRQNLVAVIEMDRQGQRQVLVQR